LQHHLPFAWHIRLSKRAKRPRITLDKYGKVELVWPNKMPQKYALDMMVKHAQWVLKHLARQPEIEQLITRPTTIYFQAIAEQWDVKYEVGAGKKIAIAALGSTLSLRGQVDDDVLLRSALCDWVKLQGERYLIPWLAKQADVMGVSYAGVSMRLQKRRWGSCSANKRINLNAGLLFLPEILVKHVLIHELCHLKHLNHSASFWAEVAQFEPDYVQNRKILRQESSLVPPWLHQNFHIS